MLEDFYAVAQLTDRLHGEEVFVDDNFAPKSKNARVGVSSFAFFANDVGVE
jgi:hypothetical protein